MIFHPNLRTKHRFRITDCKNKEDETTRRKCFESILSKKKEEKKVNKNIEEIKVIRKNHSAVYKYVLQKYFEKLDEYKIRFFER